MIKAIIVDGDNTLWKGRVSEGIGKSFLMNELKRLHIKHVVNGIKWC